MSRWSPYDTDEARLPEGMTRVGYDADEQVYTFRDSDGSYWESAPGNQYGRLTKVSGPASSDDDRAPFLGGGGAQPDDGPRASWRHDMMPMLNFGVIVGVCLLLLFWFMSAGGSGSGSGGKSFSCPDGMSAYKIQGGDTCWKISEEHGLTVDELVTGNTGLDCDALQVGSQICIPPSSSSSSAEAPGV